MTAAQKLIVLWEQRDNLYRQRRLHGMPHPLSDEDAAWIRFHRMKEARELPEKQRAAAFAELERWSPPEVME